MPEQDSEQAPVKEPVQAKAQGSGPEKAQMLDLAQAMVRETDSARDLERVRALVQDSAPEREQG